MWVSYTVIQILQLSDVLVSKNTLIAGVSIADSNGKFKWARWQLQRLTG